MNRIKIIGLYAMDVLDHLWLCASGEWRMYTPGPYSAFHRLFDRMDKRAMRRAELRKQRNSALSV